MAISSRNEVGELSDTPERRGRLPHLLAVTFWLSFAAMIAFETLYSRPWTSSSEYMFSTALLLSILALGWVLADSRAHGIETSKLLNVAMIVVPLLAVPYYRFRHFGAKAGFTLLGIIVLCFAGLFAFAYALEYILANIGSL